MKKVSAILLIIVISFSGSATASTRRTSKDTVQGWLSQSMALQVQEAFLNGEEVYVEFKTYIPDNNNYKSFYARASWESWQVEHLNNVVASLEFIDEQSWLKKTTRMRRVPGLAGHHWSHLRKELVRNIVPSDTKQAILVPTEDGEYVYYYDEADQLQIRPVAEKPFDVEINRTITQSDLTNQMLVLLNNHFERIGFKENVALLATEEQNFEYPFILVDLDRDITVNLKFQWDQEKYKGSKLTKGVKSTDSLLVNSHIWGIVSRPFSSAFRLFSWTGGTTYDVLRPKPLPVLGSKEIPLVNQGDGMNLGEWESYLTELLGRSPSRGKIKFLIGGEAYFTRLIQALSDSKKSVLLRTFIFDNDDYAVKFADILKGRSKIKGMDIRVLLDGMGQIMGEEAYPETLPVGYVPPASMAKYLKKKSKVKVRVQPNFWLKADHIKTTIIDEEFFFTGGMNIGREYRYDWHDLMMEVSGPVVQEVVRDFHRTWDYAGLAGDLSYVLPYGKNEDEGSEDDISLRLLYTRPNDPQIFKAQLEAIRQAKKYIYINNAYFSDNAILQELIKARRRGVDVRVILPIDGNHEIMNASNVVTANIMFRNGIRVFFYPGMSHVKAAVYDGWMCAGSANFDKLSLRDNLELNLATSDKATVAELVMRLFDPDFDKSKEMTQLLESGWKEYLAEFLAEQL